ncbi:MAG: hypothetical protein WD068_03250 [Candidatus Babeliales bacterium]
MKRYFLCLFFIPSSLYGLALGDRLIVQATALQSDQKIVVTGSTIVDNASHAFVARVTTAGLLDTSFSADGVVTVAINDDDRGTAIVVDGSGNVLIGGNSAHQGFIARFTSAGVLDTTFGTSGVAMLTIGAVSRINAMVLDGDGKIVVAGMTGGIMQMFIARFTSAGSLDIATFGTNGVTVVQKDNRSEIFNCILQSTNILVAGYSETGQGGRIARIARFDASGALDTDFGVAGFASINDVPRQAFYDLDVQTTGSIIAVGSRGNDILVSRFSSSGILDATFGTDGTTITSVAGVNQARAVVIDGSENIILAGKADESALILSYDANGTLNTGFGTQGIILERTDSNDSYSDILIQADEKIVCVGPAIHNALIARYSSAGLLDVSGFGVDGFVNDLNGLISFPGAVTLIWDQKAQGSSGGDFSSGAWRARDLNRLAGNVGGVTLADNEFTLQPGVYLIEVKAPAYAVGSHKARLYNVTDDVVEQYGINMVSTAGSDLGMNASVVEHTVSIGTSKTYRIEHQCGTTRSTDGFGLAANFTGAPEIYTSVTIQKLT